MSKKLYYEFSDNGDISGIILDLSGIIAWIETDSHDATADDDGRQYTITPIWMTEEEFKNLPEAEF